MIIINTGIDDGSLPRSTSLVTQLKAVPSLLSWHRASPENLNPPNPAEETPVIDVFNLMGTAGTFSNYAGKAGRPVYASGRLNGRPGLVFDGTNDVLVQFGETWDLTAPWTMAVVYWADPAGGEQTPLAAYDSTTVVTGFIQDNDQLSLRHGRGNLVLPLKRGQPVFAMLASDTATIRGRVNGFDYGPGPTDNVQPIRAPRLGSLDDGTTANLRGTIMDVWFFADDLLGHDRATAALLERYVTARRIYNFGFNPLRAR